MINTFPLNFSRIYGMLRKTAIVRCTKAEANPFIPIQGVLGCVNVHTMDVVNTVAFGVFLL